MVELLNRIGGSRGRTGGAATVPPAEWSRPPIGRAFVSFTVALLVLFVAAVVEPQLDVGELTPAGTSERLGLVAATVFAIAALLCGHRALMVRSSYLGAIAAVLAAGAAWSSSTFLGGTGDPTWSAVWVSIVALLVAVLLLAEGLWRARWLGVFCGLGAVGVTLGSQLVRVGVNGPDSAIVALLVAVSAMTGLYGILVEFDVDHRRVHGQLLASKQEIEAEIGRTEELLHDLRSGLLSIELAIDTVESEIARSLRAEAARLRQLTLPSGVERDGFDLVPGLRSLVSAKRAGGLDIELVTPPTVLVVGDESDLLAVAENLITNAQRHGEPPVVVTVGQSRHRVTLSVSDAGGRLAGNELATLLQGAVAGRNRRGRHGLGLARASRVAASNRARLTAAVTTDGRTDFVLVLEALA